jgi:hypothetical protein
MINTSARLVDKRVIGVEDNQFLGRLKIPAEPFVWYMRQETEWLQKMPEQFDVEHEGITISTHGW